MNHNTLINILFGILLFGCNSASKETVKPNITGNPTQQTTQINKAKIKLNSVIFVPGTTIQAQITYNESTEPDSVVISVGNEKLNTITKPTTSIEFNLNYNKTGRTTLQFKLFWQGGDNETVHIPIVVNSDYEPQKFGYKIKKTYPHNTKYYTQGLEFSDGLLFEGTGQWGESSLIKWDLDNNDVLQSINLGNEMFGEGISILGDKVFQLTWRSNIGFAYDKSNLKKVYEFNYPTEGWGLTNNEQELIMSDGTETIYFMDSELFQEIRRIYVYDTNGPVANLNELEYIDGLIYANVYTTNTIVAIDPNTGKVLKYIDLTGLLNKVKITKPIDVLNGIAFDKKNNRLIVTGKYWPLLFEIELIKTH